MRSKLLQTMLYKYKASIRPDLESKEFRYFDYALISRKRILDKWFYFYMNDPIKPLIVWNDKDIIGIQIQPGTNRYIGTALRNKDIWLDAVYISNDQSAPAEIKLHSLIETIDDRLDTSYISLDNEVHRWGIGNQTLYDRSWIPPVYDWVHDNLKYKWGLEYQGKIYYVNAERRLNSLFKTTKLIVRSSDFISVQDAVKHLFETIRSFEFGDL